MVLNGAEFRPILLTTVFFLLVSPGLCAKWSSWSRWSDCSRTCDGGATYRERTCVSGYGSGGQCRGSRVKYNTCNNKPCAPDSVDFRTQQCTAYNNASYGGKLYEWLPYTDRKNRCILYCIPKGTRTVVRLAPTLLDGTRCRLNSYDMCIHGKCRKVGCDHKLDSPARFDSCGICGGNNSCVKKRPKGRYQWIEIGLSPCTASCGVGIQAYQYRCRDRLTGNQVPDSRCARSPKPKGRQKSCFRRQCPPVWKIFPWQACSKSCGGGLATRAVRCMDTRRDGRQEWHHDSFCPSPKPTAERPCNKHMCPRWDPGHWSPCSVTCGWGLQVREVVCRHEGKTFCDFTTKPVTRRNCTTIFPCSDPDDSRPVADHAEEKESKTPMSLYQELRSSASMSDMEVVNKDDTHNHDMSKPRFVVSDWGSCSGTCGVAIRHRYVRCQVHLQYMHQLMDVREEECNDPKPPETEPCKLKPCYDDYIWVKRGMTECSRSCLSGTQETLVECIHKSNRTKSPDSHCIGAPKPSVSRRSCNEFPCPQRWRIGDFDECSSTCGGGMMTRDVRCIQQIDIDRDKVLKLPDVMCEEPVPQRSRKCNTQPCLADWETGHWSECSTTCGLGIQLRPVVCQRKTAHGEPIDVDQYHCPPSEKPLAEKPCNVSACPEVRIKKRKVDFFQINKMPKVRLNVGTVAAVLPGSALVLRCPVKGMDRRGVEWMKNGIPLRRGNRVTITNRGSLRIRRSLPQADAGNYTCVASNKKASVNITFSDLYLILQQTMKREKYLRGYLADQSRPNTSVMMKDPFDRKRRPLHLMVSNWSACSASCGGGVRKRKITCEIITNSYFEVFPLKACKKAGLQIPDPTEKCNTHPCTRWMTKDWSKCLTHKCVRKGYSIQIRSVSCVAGSTKATKKHELCDVRRKPLTRKECSNPLCKPKWNTSKWSDCMASCGKSGFQTRMLTCLWKGNGQPAGRSCERLRRPTLTRSCYNSCTHGMWPNKNNHHIDCVDNNDYCTVVPKMKLCRFTTFKKKCCHSCSSLSEDPPS